MERVVVIGSGGSGKSTFSTDLGRITGLPVIHLDREYWRPGWQEPPKEEWERRVGKLLAGERWIMDGNYGGTREARFRSADTIIFLDLPTYVCVYRIVKRTIKYRGMSRPDMAAGCSERFDLEFISWVWNYRGQRRKRLMSELEALQDKRVMILTNRRQVREFLAKQQG